MCVCVCVCVCVRTCVRAQRVPKHIYVMCVHACVHVHACVMNSGEERMWLCIHVCA